MGKLWFRGTAPGPNLPGTPRVRRVVGLFRPLSSL